MVERVSEIRVVDRDYRIIEEINRWRVCTGRAITALAGFGGTRACDRRLSKLCQAGYLERKRVLYGTPGIYTITHKGRLLAGLPERPESIRVEQIPHDIAVVETAIYFHKVKGIPLSDITTEKQLHQQDGFGVRKHRPDFVITRKNKTYCVEVELSLKAKARLEANIRANFLAYDFQIWIVPDKQCRIYQILADNRKQYQDISILELQEVQKHD